MIDEKISIFMKDKKLRSRSVDKEKIASLINSSKENSEVAISVNLNEKSATLIFREIYESIRQIGDAKWWILGYEPLNHDVSLDILKEIEIKDRVKLNYLDRFRKIRNDANYRGFKVTELQAKEIINFWKKYGAEIINSLKL